MFGVYFWVCLYPAVPVMYLDGKELALCLGVFLLCCWGFFLLPSGLNFSQELLPPSQTCCLPPAC